MKDVGWFHTDLEQMCALFKSQGLLTPFLDSSGSWDLRLVGRGIGQWGPLSTRDHVEGLGLDGHEVGPGLVEGRALGGRELQWQWRWRDSEEREALRSVPG